eukprot:CAMPEP_0113906838 /NCGR_PEP_ID=MMETSP0780_2-20120614/25050_1 /TAXON_ID=652834 /ORGANISM="Palpitomonas bilix" /LENGTH=68 /DNA_ID=CAMNT_0000901643 /DNA_START=161 /DNA_END=364 /DNA_ORIENTATION=- /assembly_acc=CAM_ASM_000599
MLDYQLFNTTPRFIDGRIIYVEESDLERKRKIDVELFGSEFRPIGPDSKVAPVKAFKKETTKLVEFRG